MYGKTTDESSTWIQKHLHLNQTTGCESCELVNLVWMTKVLDFFLNVSDTENFL